MGKLLSFIFIAWIHKILHVLTGFHCFFCSISQVSVGFDMISYYFACFQVFAGFHWVWQVFRIYSQVFAGSHSFSQFIFRNLEIFSSFLSFSHIFVIFRSSLQVYSGSPSFFTFMQVFTGFWSYSQFFAGFRWIMHVFTGFWGFSQVFAGFHRFCTF